MLNINDEGAMETTPLAIAVETKKYRMVRKIFEKAPDQVMKKSFRSRSAFNLSLNDPQALEIFLQKPEVLDFSKAD